MDRPLNPFARWHPWRRKNKDAEKLYGAIVARARLPVFYQAFGVPDSLEGRFLVLSLHLFAVLHALRAGTAEAADLSQELIDTHAKDMETVLRETGVGDLSIPKKMRDLATKSAGLLQSYETAFSLNDEAFAVAIASALPLDADAAQDAARRLARSVTEMIGQLSTQSVTMLSAGVVEIPIVSEDSAKVLRERLHD